MADQHRPRVMIDTTVLVAGSGWPRWPYEVLLAGVRGDFKLVLTPYILDQTRRVLRQRFPRFLDRFEEFLAQVPIEWAPDPSPEEVSCHQGLVRDPTDIPIALAAINAGVDYLVSEDKDLTTMDVSDADLTHELAVMLPGTFLRKVLNWDDEQLEAVRKRTWEDLRAKGTSEPV